jgi:hypothetical protein
MTIFIGDVNEHAPTFQQEVYEVTISPLSDIGNYSVTVNLISKMKMTF